MSAPSRSDAAEAGFSLIEVLVTMVLLGIISSGLLFTITRSMETTRYTQDRNIALDQLRLMTASFSKDLRQGIQATAISPDRITFDTYVDSEVKRVTWQVSETGGEQRLERLVDGDPAAVYVVDLTHNAILSYFGANSPAGVHRVRISLETQPDPQYPPIEVATVVEMRNAN